MDFIEDYDFSGQADQPQRVVSNVERTEFCLVDRTHTKRREQRAFLGREPRQGGMLVICAIVKWCDPQVVLDQERLPMNEAHISSQA